MVTGGLKTVLQRANLTLSLNVDQDTNTKHKQH